MKTLSRPFLLGCALAWIVTLTPAGLAQEPKASAVPTTPTAPAAPASPAATDAPPSPAASTTPVAPSPSPAPAAETNPSAAEQKQNDGLRRIDVEAPVAPDDEQRTNPVNRGWSNGRYGRDRIVIGDDVTLQAGEHAADVVAILGSATSAGEVSRSLVSILGNTRSTGSVGRGAVAVGGNVYVNGKVAEEVVAVFGNVELGPEAVVRGDVVSVGGRVIRDPKAIVHGDVNGIPIGMPFSNPEWLRQYVLRCVMWARPLALGSELGWAWTIAVSALGFYLLLALLFRRGVEKCAVTLETRPGYSILSSVLTVFLAPLAIALLIATVVGIAVVPFLLAGIFFAVLFGKATMCAWVGRRFTKFFGDGPLSHVAFAVLIGGLILLALYTVPILGLMLFMLLGWLGLGVVIYTILLGMKREKPPAAPRSPMPIVTPPTPPAPASPGPLFAQQTESSAPFSSAARDDVAPAVSSPPIAPAMSAGFSGESRGWEAAGVVATAVPPPPGGSAYPPSPAAIHHPPPRPNLPISPAAAVALPRATLMQRLGALAIDGIMLFALLGFAESLFPRQLQVAFMPRGLLLALGAYGAVMWRQKGTTIGGIVCGLKVVRLDGREIDWGTAIVRALGCFLSLVVVGLGFIWIAFDDERQSWHDKIAGTVVVRVPKGASLV